MKFLDRKLHVTHQVIHPNVGSAHAEVAARHIFQFMSLVKDHRGCFRQNPRIGCPFGRLLDREIGEVQVMVHDDDVALGSGTPHLGDEAALKLFALRADAGIRTRIELRPELARLRDGRQFGAIAGRGDRSPTPV